MKDSSTDNWMRLVEAARKATSEDGDDAAPLGFSTRVAAQWKAGKSDAPSALALFEKWSLRAAGLAVVAFALVSFSSAQKSPDLLSPVSIEIPGDL